MVHPTNLVILFQGDHLLISYRARDTFALCTIADVSSLVNISRKNVQCWWPTFSLQETAGWLLRRKGCLNHHTVEERNLPFQTNSSSLCAKEKWQETTSRYIFRGRQTRPRSGEDYSGTNL